MKNLLIMGAIRSGKSTLCSMISERFRFDRVPQDAMVTAFEKIFPECGIKHGDTTRSAFGPWLFEYMKELAYESGRFVVEGCHVGVRVANKLIDKDKWRMVVLGYPGLTPEQAFAEVRKNDQPHDWTRDITDDVLMQCMTDAVEESKRYQSECGEFGIEFIDVSTDRLEKLARFAAGFD